jgi:type IV pilus assembly protein PilQ
MSKHRKSILAALAVWVLVAGAFQVTAIAEDLDEPGQVADAPPIVQATGGDLTEVVVASSGSGNPVVTLVANELRDYDSFVLENPPRLVVDLYGVTSRLETHHYEVGEAGVARVRAGQYRREPDLVSRVVFDLETTVPYEIDLEGSSIVVSFTDIVTDTESAIAQTESTAETVAVAAPTIEEIIAESTAPPASSIEEWVDTTEAPAPAPVPVIADHEVPVEQGDVIAAEVDEISIPAEPVSEVAELPTVPTEPVETAAIEPVTVASVEPTEVASPEPVEAPSPEPAEGRALQEDALERLLQTPTLASTKEEPTRAIPTQSFETKTIVAEETVYGGKLVSLNLVDADIKQVFRLFHEISGLNFVLHPQVDGRVTIVLDNVPWDLALDLILKNNGLDKVMEGNVIRIAPTQQLAAEAAQRKQLKLAEELEVEPVTITRTLSYARARDVERVVREGGVLSERGKVIVDERTNTLIVSDIPKKVEPLDILISSLDSETPQVMIEARIVETSREFIQDFGVQWGYTLAADAAHGTSTGASFPHNVTNKYSLNLGSTDTGDVSGIHNLAFSFGNVIDSFTLDIALDALETEGKGRILSAPKIATQNNERAEIEQGVRIPVVNTTATEINVEYVSASLRLMVTPQITAEGTIILDVQVENNSPDFVNTVGDVPPINTQRAQTKVLINDGGTTVIGGIFKVTEGVSETGVPWFRKIPVFGWLFKNRSIQNENRELLIFITPRIMKIG